MSKKFVPAAIVALTALAATGSAFAHDVIVPRQGFDTALASAESQSSGASGRSLASAQGQAQAASQAVKVSGAHNPNVFADAYPGASSGNYTWWKDR
jgi:hypothetical protein